MERTPLNDWMTLLATAALAGFIGLVAGAIFAGEAGTFREWISALSGWVAGIGAVMVGVFTIRPLVRQVQLQEVAAKNTFMTLAVSALNRIGDARTELGRASVFIKRSERFIPADALEVMSKASAIQSEIEFLRSAAKNAEAALSDSLIKDGAVFGQTKRFQAFRAIGLMRVTLIELEIFNAIATTHKPSKYDEIRTEYERLFAELDGLENEAEARIMDYLSEIAALL